MASQSTNGSAYSGQNDTGEDSAANTQSDAGIDAEQYADSDRSIAAPEPIADESVQTQVQTRPVLTLPQSLHPVSYTHLKREFRVLFCAKLRIENGE